MILPSSLNNATVTGSEGDVVVLGILAAIKAETDKIPTLATQASVDALPSSVPTAEQNADAILGRVI